MRNAKHITYPEMWKKVKKVYDQTQKQIELLPWIGDVEYLSAGGDEEYYEDAKKIYEEMIEYENTLEDFLQQYRDFKGRMASNKIMSVVNKYSIMLHKLKKAINVVAVRSVM